MVVGGGSKYCPWYLPVVDLPGYRLWSSWHMCSWQGLCKKYSLLKDTLYNVRVNLHLGVTEGEFILMGISFVYLPLQFMLKCDEQMRIDICIFVDVVCCKIGEVYDVFMNLVDVELLIYNF